MRSSFLRFSVNQGCWNSIGDGGVGVGGGGGGGGNGDKSGDAVKMVTGKI
jgi:hypothetical protein